MLFERNDLLIVFLVIAASGALVLGMYHVNQFVTGAMVLSPVLNELAAMPLDQLTEAEQSALAEQTNIVTKSQQAYAVNAVLDLALAGLLFGVAWFRSH